LSSLQKFSMNSDNSTSALEHKFSGGEFPTEMQEGNSLMKLKIPCETKEGEQIEVEVGLLLQSTTFKNMWKDLGIANDSEQLSNGFSFPVKAISGPIFRKVVDWCREHVGVDEPVVEEDPITRERKWFDLTEFEKKFFDVELEELAEFLVAGNFLDIKSLYLYGCQSMAALIKDKTPEQVREMFGLEDDLTEEEKTEIRKKNVWCNY